MELLQLLWQHRIIHFDFDKGFQWSSGVQAPMYVDTRLLLSFPDVRSMVLRFFSAAITQEITHVAAVATGAIAWGALLSHTLEKPFFYVRKQPKSHGKQQRIEGLCPKEAKIILVEDVLSTGQSALEALKAIEEQHAKVQQTLCIFSYGLAPKALNPTPLVDFFQLTAFLQKEKILTFEEINRLLSWYTNLNHHKSYETYK